MNMIVFLVDGLLLNGQKGNFVNFKQEEILNFKNCREYGKPQIKRNHAHLLYGVTEPHSNVNIVVAVIDCILLKAF